MDTSMMSNGYSSSHSAVSSQRHGPAGSSKARSTASSRTMSRNVRRLQECVNLHLNNYEKELFLDALNEFHSERDTWGFVEVLKTILNTPAKQQLVPMIRLVLPSNEIPEFDKCVQLSAAIARGENGAGRLLIGHSSATSTPQTPRSSHRHDVMSVSHGRHSPREPERRSRSRQKHRVSDDLNVIQVIPDSRGIGFTTTSSFNNRRGVFISYVDSQSKAFAQGLSIGDEILEANDIDLHKTSYEDATSILRAARHLTLTVQHNASVDGGTSKKETYTWVDAEGRPCSPPLLESDMDTSLRSSVSRRSGMTLISNQDERKINLRIEKGAGLGLTIRGGAEYGLGVYITGVDPGSAASRSGIRVGDQILAVNDTQFVDISHKEAVKVLKKSRHMMLTIRHVGKLPHAKINRTKMIVPSGRSASVAGRRSRQRTRVDNSSSDELFKASKMRYPGSLDRSKYYQKDEKINTATPDELDFALESAFVRGAGSQLMLQQNNLMMSHTRIDEQARNLLNEQERGTLRFYLDEYSKGYVSVDALVAALGELFNSHAKFTLFREVAGLIQNRDLKRYNTLVLKQEVHSLKHRREARQEELSEFSLDSILSVPSNSSTNETLSLNLGNLSSGRGKSANSHNTSEINDGKSSVRSNRMLITDGSTSRTVMSDRSGLNSLKRSVVTSAEINLSSVSAQHSSNENSPRDGNGKQNVPRMGMRAAQISKSDTRSPSDDSGVDIKQVANSALTNHTPSSSSTNHRADDSDTDSSLDENEQHRKKSYSLNGINDTDSEDDPIPGLHDSPQTSSATDNVILLKQEFKSTLPRNRKTDSSSANNTYTPPSPGIPSFRQQVKDRQALSGRMYLPPAANASLRQEIPVSDSDYDTADILNLSRQLYLSNQNATKHQEPHSDLISESSTIQATDDISIAEEFPPPPPHILPDQSSTHSSTPKHSRRQEVEASADTNSRRTSISSVQSHLSQSRRAAITENDYAVPEIDDKSESESPAHPAVILGRSPHGERRNSKPEAKSSSIYAVIKKQHQIRPPAPFTPPPPLNPEPETTADNGIPAVPAKLNIQDESSSVLPNQSTATNDTADSTSIESLPKHEEVIRVNKMKPTLGLAIEGGAGTKQPIPRIINIQETGCAHSSGLKVGHVILRINDKYLDGLSHNQAARVIADAFRDRKTSYVDFLVSS